MSLPIGARGSFGTTGGTVGSDKAVFNMRGDDGTHPGDLGADSNLGWKSDMLSKDVIGHKLPTGN